MRANLIKLALVFFSVVATVLPAGASEITGFKIKDEPKKIKLTFYFSEAAAYSIVSDFNSNILVLNYEGLELSRKQKSNDHRLEGDKDFDVLRFVRFQDTGEQAEIRIYLGWEVSPADAQVVAFDERIEVDILKPMHLIPIEAVDTIAPEGGINDGTDWYIERGSDPGENGGGETETETAGPETPATNTDSTETGEGSGLQGVSLRQPFFPELENDGGTGGGPGQVEGAEDSSAGGTTGDAGAGDPADSGPSSDFRPAREFTATPSYKKFDLDEVDVNQLEFRSVPFNEALLDLVAGCGFNVVVGEGIDNKEVTLNFTQKKVSLERALYYLCQAYDLEYTVEDDVIIIRAK